MFGIGGRRGLLKVMLGAGLITAANISEAKVKKKIPGQYKLLYDCETYNLRYSNDALMVIWNMNTAEDKCTYFHKFKDFCGSRVIETSLKHEDKRSFMFEMYAKENSNEVNFYIYDLPIKEAHRIYNIINRAIENV